jgi:hypothetical protein
MTEKEIAKTLYEIWKNGEVGGDIFVKMSKWVKAHARREYARGFRKGARKQWEPPNMGSEW